MLFRSVSQSRYNLGMKKKELQEEIARLENATKDYTKASGEELDWQWPPYAKKQASEDLKRLTFVKTVLKKYDGLEALRRINLDDAAIIEETSKKEIN